MTVTEAPSARLHTFTAYAQVQAARAQLAADVAAGADIQVLAADKASIMSLGHRLAVSHGRIDVTV
jgi:hypothetical protein